MVEVRFSPGGQRVQVRRGTRLYDIVRSLDLPLASSCDGTGVCGRCGLRVLSGADGLSPESKLEARRKRDNRVAPALRLACLTAVRANVEVKADYW